jgi:hypothetical protein
MPIRAEVDGFTFFGVWGWACDTDDPSIPLQIELSLDSKIIATVIAGNFRQDLLDAGIGNGRHGFRMLFADAPSDSDLKRMRLVAKNGEGETLLLRSWEVLPPTDLTRALITRAFDTLYRPRPPKTVLRTDGKEEFYDGVADAIGSGPLTYLEFGVHTGWSFAQMLKRFASPGARFFGFDSFEGLPEKWVEGCDRGYFNTGGVAPTIRDSRAKFIKGWFQNTVPLFLSSNPVSPPTLIHFDADLYSSTLFLLTTLWHHVAEYHFIFDEFYPDEVVAMHDFARSFPVEVEFLSCISNLIPSQVFGRMKRIPFRPTA